MSELILGSGIGKGVKAPETTAQWFEQLQEQITEELLTEAQIESLLADPMSFLTDYTGDINIATEIQGSIITSFFTSTLNTLEKTKDRRWVLQNLALNKIDEKLTASTDDLTPVELSIIYKNLKQEN